jgi:serine/threonine protein kinase
MLGFLGRLFGKKKGPKAPKPDKKLPRIIVEKRFELIGRTGQGSMSKVWRARDRNTGKTVCLKVLDKLKTERFDARFVGLKKPSEGTILTQLKHRNIVSTYEHGLTNKGEQYIIMELIDGVGLNFLIETGSKQLRAKRISYLSQMAEGLEYLHVKGFLHRDICPRNVMIDKDDVVKLIDFGLCVPHTPEFCRPGNRTGTPNYLAPELIRRITTDHRVDLFALGVTAYEIIVGQLPWEKGDSWQTLTSHVNQPGRNPRDFKPDLDEPTFRFLLKAIERDRDKRYQTAAEFRDALRRLEE